MSDKDYELKKKLEDYYGTAMFNGNPAAIINLGDVSSAQTTEELEEMARKVGIPIPDDN